MKSRLTDLCLMAMMGTVLVVSKETLAALPNVELVSLLTILFTLVFRRRVLGALAVFFCWKGCSMVDLAFGRRCTCMSGLCWPGLPGCSAG